MPLLIVQDNITKMQVDAIVNAANNSLLGGGGVDGAIHRAAGPSLLEECRTLNGCDTGDAKITSAGDLPCRYVIHTVGPVWCGGSRNEEQLLRSCYRKSLEIASSKGLASVAFPLISSGAYGYPKDQALGVAVDEIKRFLLTGDDMLVYIVIFDRDAYTIDRKVFRDLSQRIDRTNVISDAAYAAGSAAPAGIPKRRSFFRGVSGDAYRCAGAPAAEEECEICDSAIDRSLDQRINEIDESFSSMLLRKIDESGMTDVECYKRANIDRKLFSKIRSDVYYRPSKPTVIAFAVALRLDLAETRELLMKAGFALSRSNKFDIIIEYFIENGNYDVFEINEALFAFDQPLLA